MFRSAKAMHSHCRVHKPGGSQPRPSTQTSQGQSSAGHKFDCDQDGGSHTPSLQELALVTSADKMKTASTSSNSATNESDHTKGKLFKCEICGKHFRKHVSYILIMNTIYQHV